MKRGRTIRIGLVIGLCIVVCLLTVAYAALSQTLNITGTAQVVGNTWNIYLANPSCSKTGSATAGTPSITGGTTISLSGMMLSVPGDTVTCTFDVVNGGSVNAKLSTITNLTPNVEGIGTTAASDVSVVKANYTYSLTYDTGTSIAVNDTLNAGATKKLKMYITYKTNATGIPKNDVTISNLGATLVYTQA